MPKEDSETYEVAKKKMREEENSVKKGTAKEKDIKAKKPNW